MIPLMTHELGKYWEQPSKDDILIDETHALMLEEVFKELKNYSLSNPTGAYEGKMWKCEYRDGWYLKWYQQCTNYSDMLKTHFRKILLV